MYYLMAHDKGGLEDFHGPYESIEEAKNIAREYTEMDATILTVKDGDIFIVSSIYFELDDEWEERNISFKKLLRRNR